MLHVSGQRTSNAPTPRERRVPTAIRRWSWRSPPAHRLPAKGSQLMAADPKDPEDPETVEAKKAARKALVSLWARGQILHAKAASALAQAHQLANLIETHVQWKEEVGELPTLNEKKSALRIVGNRSVFWSDFLISSFAELKKAHFGNEAAGMDLTATPMVTELVEKLEKHCQKITALHNVRMAHS